MPSRKGAPNKAKLAFRERLKRYLRTKRVDPHYFLAACIADTTTTTRMTPDGDTVQVPNVSMALKIECAKELANYLEPKLRSVVLAGDADNPVQVLHAMPQDQLDALIQRKMKEAGITAPPSAYDGGHTSCLPETEVAP